MIAAALADPAARSFPRKADPVLARVIDGQPDFHPRARLDRLPPLSAFGALIFQVAGQQLSASATRTIVARLQEHFGGHLPRRPSCSPRAHKSFAPSACRIAIERHSGHLRSAGGAIGASP